MKHIARPHNPPTAARVAAFPLAACLLLALPAAFAGKTCVSPGEGPAAAGCIVVDDVNAWLFKEQERIGKSATPTEDIAIEFQAGEFLLDVPIRLMATRGGFRGRITLSGQGPSSILRGVKKIPTAPATDADFAGWGLPPGALVARLPETAAQRVPGRQALRFGKPGAPDMDVLLDGKRLPRARRLLTDLGDVDPQDGGKAFRSVEGARRYRDEKDLYAQGYFNHDWANEEIPITGLQSQSGSFTLEEAPTYGIRRNARIWISNALADLVPGSWVHNRQRNAVFLIPPEGTQPTRIEIPLVPVAVLADTTSNLSVRNLAIDGFQREGLRFNNVTDSVVDTVAISNIGGTGASINGSRVDLHALTVRDIGGAGVSLSGGNRSTLTPGNVRLSESHIHDVGIFRPTYSPAVALNGVGNAVTDSYLHDGPHIAVLFHGNDHRIAANRIERFVTDTDDAGAIYTGQDWTERGTVIENNLVSDIGGKISRTYKAKGVYLDDQASGITVRNNVFIRVAHPVFIGGGRDNTIESNWMSQCEAAVSADNRGERNLATAAGQATHRNLLAKLQQLKATSPPYATRYPRLAQLANDAPGSPRGNRVDGNISVRGCTSLALRGIAPADISTGTNRVQADAPDTSRLRPPDLPAFIDNQRPRATGPETTSTW